MFSTPELVQHHYAAQRGLLAEVVFGNPKSDCRNLGVCKMHIGPKAIVPNNELIVSKKCCPSAIAFLRIKSQKALLIHFLNYSLKPEWIQKYFPQNHFVVEERFELSSALHWALELGKGKFSLLPGHYQAHNDGIYHTVTIPLGRPVIA